MSVVLVTDCPYCVAENTTFLYETSYETSNGKFWVMFKCPCCQGAIVAKGTIRNDVYSKIPSNRKSVSLESLAGNLAKLMDDIKIYPQRPPIDAPDSLPHDIERLYIRACESFRRKDMDSAAMLTRKCLEVALKQKFGEIQEKLKLNQRIERLAKDYLLTPDMVAWANAIRFGGNDASHDAPEPELENTKQMKEFLYVFLLYTFTLPAMIEARKPKPL